MVVRLLEAGHVVLRYALFGLLEFCGWVPAYFESATPSGLKAEPGAVLAWPGVTLLSQQECQSPLATQDSGDGDVRPELVGAKPLKQRRISSLEKPVCRSALPHPPSEASNRRAIGITTTTSIL